MKPTLYKNLYSYMETVASEFALIPAERVANLHPLVQHIRQQRTQQHPIRLVFICTHNSRRSQFGEAWAAAAAHFYGLTEQDVQTYSGGTETTAFNPAAMAALERAGFTLRSSTPHPNPKIALHFSDDNTPKIMFSKIYSDSFNPTEDFVAVLVCSHADEGCPWVRGAEIRLYHGYEDPKRSDNTPQETAIYDASCREIAREMLYLFHASTRS